MQLTKSQLHRFWRDWSDACKTQGWTKANGWTPAQIDNERYSLLRLCGFDSLTEVDRAAGFDKVLGELGRLRDDIARTAETLPARKVTLPAGHGSQTHRDTPGLRRRLEWKARFYARDLGGDPYILSIARDRFGITAGLSTIDDLDTEQLQQLMMTLAARHQAAQDRAELRKADAMAEPEAQDSTEAWWEQEALKEAETAEREEANSNPF